MNIKQVQRILLTNFFFMVVVALLLVGLYEMEILAPTDMASDATLMFVILTMMELVTIVVIPVALKLFSLKAIHRKLVNQKVMRFYLGVQRVLICFVYRCWLIFSCIIRRCRQPSVIWQ